MKKTLILVFFLLPFFSFAAEQEINIGVFVHAPHVYKNIADEPYGPAVEYIKKAVISMGYIPNIRLLPLPRILIYLKSGEIDISLELLKTDEREDFLFYSEQPTYKMVQSLTFLSTNKLNEIRQISDLDGIKIGYLSGANIGPFLESSSSIDLEFVSGDKWIQQNLAKLLSGRIDAALDNNSYSYRDEAKIQGVQNKIKTLSLPGEGTAYYVVFSKKSPMGAELLQKYNNLMAKTPFNEQDMIDEFLSK